MSFDQSFLDSLINPDQKSQAWLDERSGRFTSSEIHRLMAAGYREMTEAELAARPKKGKGSSTTRIEVYDTLSSGAMTYVKEKVCERLTGVQKYFSSYQTEWGDTHEPIARDLFAKLMNVEVKPSHFMPFSTMAGGSPDGHFVLDNQLKTIEIKCPEVSTNHLDNLRLKNVDEFRELHPEYYCQIQCNMLWTKTDEAYFISFDPRMPEPLQIRWLVIPRDIELQQRVLLKVEAAEIKAQQILVELTQLVS